MVSDLDAVTGMIIRFLIPGLPVVIIAPKPVALGSTTMSPH